MFFIQQLKNISIKHNLSDVVVGCTTEYHLYHKKTFIRTPLLLPTGCVKGREERAFIISAHPTVPTCRI